MRSSCASFAHYTAASCLLVFPRRQFLTFPFPFFLFPLNLEFMFRILRYIVYTVCGIILGGLNFEAATLPRTGALATAHPATTSMIETRIRQAQENGQQPKRGR